MFDERAHTLLTEALALRRQLGGKESIALSLHNLGDLARELGEYGRARTLLTEALTVGQQLGATPGIAVILASFGQLLAAQKQWGDAARLMGAAAALQEMIGAGLPMHQHHARERAVRTMLEALGGEAFAANWAAGRALPVDQAIVAALEGRCV